MSTVEHAFDAAMFEIYQRANHEAGYNATRFLRMLTDHGGLETARTLVNSEAVSEGYTALWERGRLDLTVEAMIIDHRQFHTLFTDAELETARQRLQDYGYISTVESR